MIEVSMVCTRAVKAGRVVIIGLFTITTPGSPTGLSRHPCMGTHTTGYLPPSPGPIDQPFRHAIPTRLIIWLPPYPDQDSLICPTSQCLWPIQEHVLLYTIVEDIPPLRGYRKHRDVSQPRRYA